MKKFIQIGFNPDFHKVFKSVCSRNGVTMSDQIKELMLDFINKEENPVSMGMPFDDAIEHPRP